jgi:hypothetical protein
MKPGVFFFAHAFLWRSIHGRELESLTFLRGSDVEAVMEKNAKPATSEDGSLFHERRLRRLPATNTTCDTTSIVVLMQAARNNTVEELLSCDTADGKHYVVQGAPDHLIQANKKGIIDGAIELSLPAGAYLDEDTATLKMPSSGGVKLKERMGKHSDNSKEGLIFDRSRRSLAVTGIRSALVVRVIASGVATEFSQARLSHSVFGNGADGTLDSVTMKSHFGTCSNGQLSFVQANNRDGRSIQIRNGKYQLFAERPPQVSITRNSHFPLICSCHPHQEPQL